ncbi:MAG: type II toxin-antitoxin system PemK/MazF family toxin [Ignavibacteriae bacterium]|nr:MAG: type II toxin-antitoxin system PemK/MazF family toxin [Ignavibacteriota bacterium]
MINYKFGDVVLLSFPYTDSSNNKKRPAMVLLDTKDDDIIVSRITSKINESEYDSEIKDWKLAGLLFPSTTRLHKIATINKELVERKLGEFSKNDSEKAAGIVKKLFGSI